SSFPEIYRALVRAGEHSGELSAVMASVADYLERRQATRQSAGLALLYPAIVAAVALCIVVGLLTYVVPQVVEVYAQSRQPPPWSWPASPYAGPTDARPRRSAGTRGCCACRSSARSGEASTRRASPRAS